jgi:hypothetical protein
LKLEFCLQEARSQTRKLQRVSLVPALIFFFSFKKCLNVLSYSALGSGSFSAAF